MSVKEEDGRSRRVAEGQTVTNRLGPLWFQLIVGGAISHSTARLLPARRRCKYPERRHESKGLKVERLTPVGLARPGLTLRPL